MWTGYNAPHDGWLGNQTLPYNISKILTKFRNDNKNITLFYCLGNHEKYPFDPFYDEEKDIRRIW